MAAVNEEKNGPTMQKSETAVPDRITAVRAGKRRAEEQARIEGKALAEAEAKEVADRTTRLRAARLAKEAAEEAAAGNPVLPRRNTTKLTAEGPGASPRKRK